MDSKVSFIERVDNKIYKCSKITDITKRLSLTLSRKKLLKMQISLVRCNLGIADINHDKPFDDFFKRKLDMVQHKITLGIIVAMKGTFRHKIYLELGLKYLADIRWSHIHFSSTKSRINSYHHLIFCFLVRECILYLSQQRSSYCDFFILLLFDLLIRANVIYYFYVCILLACAFKLHFLSLLIYINFISEVSLI